MSWVKDALKALRHGEDAKVRPHGGSMRGLIESGQEVTLRAADFDELAVGDVVFVRWKGNYLLHLVKALRRRELLIGNNLGKVNGWASADDVLAKVVHIGNPESSASSSLESSASSSWETLLARVQSLEDSGYVILVKWDGERERRKKTVLLSKPGVDELVFRGDGDDLEALLRDLVDRGDELAAEDDD